MASITLRDIWVHRASAPSSYVTFEAHKLTTRSIDPGNQAKRYGSGRIRGVTIPGTLETLSLDLGFEDRAKFEQLKVWAKEVLMFRDLKGRREWGLLSGITEKDFGHGMHDVAGWTMTFNIVTYEEGVA